MATLLAFSACGIQVHNVRFCSVLGLLSDGGSCAETLTGKEYDLTLDEYLDFLQPQPERECVPVGRWEKREGATYWVQDIAVCSSNQLNGVKMKLPKRGGAVCLPAADFVTMKGDLETACRELGDNCTLEIQRTIEVMNSML